MAEKNSSNDGQYFLASSQNETDKVDSDMDAAARQCASTKKKTYFQPEVRSRKTSENSKPKMSKASQDPIRTFKIAAIPQKQRLSNNPGKKWNKFPQAGVSRKHDGEFRTITMKKGKQCRLRTALKLLDILEGKYDDSDSECSLDSKSLHRSVKRSTRRLQAMRDDHTPRDFIGLCRDCRSRCRNCGRRPSAVLMARRKRY
ncbi:GM17233 [Drosophila sechellia]|uniref:GM17233 n=1 Tax=Drosophila sechellia TaxID=7238 RepID=B4I594_DROSE|nr:GM17233 [Drosophila sechellia]